jgi:hypothetical protein
MQTNAPAGGEWVDQYNRAVAFGQIDVDQLANLPAHASTHAVGGSDPVTPSSIGAVSLVTNNTSTVPQSVSLRVDGVNLLAALNTNTLLYTVPAGFTFTATSVKMVITNSNQTTTGFSTAPEFELQNGSGVKTCNALTLAVAPRLFANGDVIMAGGSFGGGSTARRISTDTANLKVTIAAVGGNQTTMLATVFVQGELYS